MKVKFAVTSSDRVRYDHLSKVSDLMKQEHLKTTER